MITSFEVGAVFKIINEASPALLRILKQIRELNASIDKARENLALIGKPAAMGTAIAETADLAKAWGDVAKNAGAARLAIGQAAATAVRSAPAAAAASGGGAGAGGRHRPRWLGGAHVGGPGVGIPGGGHVRFGGAGMAAAGALGWGVDQAAKTADYVWRMEDISGSAHDRPTHEKFRKILQDAQINTGFSLDAVGKSALAVIRLMQATPGNGIDTLPEMLSSAATEARRKGVGLEESMTSAAELAHQFRTYDPKSMQSLFSTFAALSTADPRSLSAMTRASGYAVPTLSELGVDPASVLLAGTGLAQAGISSTKSGTWIREAISRALPGIVLGHRASNKKHEEALRALGLVGKDGKPTWFTDGKPDEFKMFEIAGAAMQGMSPTQRAVYGRAAFGAQGSGAVAVLGDPVVNARMQAIGALTKSKPYLDRYKSFGRDYEVGSTMQTARTALAQFNVTIGELARTTLPAVNVVLGDFKSTLDRLRSMAPGGDGNGGAIIGGRAIEGAAAGAIWGAFGGPLGVVGGAAAGGIVGGVEGVAEQYMRNNFKSVGGIDKGGSYTSPGKTGRPAAEKTTVEIKPAPFSLSINLDGQLLSQTMTQLMLGPYSFPTQAPTFDGSGSWVDGDHQHSDN